MHLDSTRRTPRLLRVDASRMHQRTCILGEKSGAGATALADAPVCALIDMGVINSPASSSTTSASRHVHAWYVTFPSPGVHSSSSLASTCKLGEVTALGWYGSGVYDRALHVPCSL